MSWTIFSAFVLFVLVPIIAHSKCPEHVFKLIEYRQYLAVNHLNYFTGLTSKDCAANCVHEGNCTSFSYRNVRGMSECYTFENRVWPASTNIFHRHLATYWKLENECPRSYIYNETYNVCYKPYLNRKDKRNWTEAMTNCVKDGGYLFLGDMQEKWLMISDLYTNLSSENNGIMQDERDKMETFIGAADAKKDGSWQWLNGQNVTYWGPNEPNNYKKQEYCAILQFRNVLKYRTQDYPCFNPSYFICEVPVKP